jgi:hypothetical protein
MARKAAERKRAKKPATVTVRFANGGSKMAKRKGGKRRKNPANPTKRRGSRRNPRRRALGRRRNPPNTFGDRVMRLAGGALVAVGTGVAVIYGQSKIQPGTSLSLYGVPAAAFLAGAALAKNSPMLGGGIALGAFAPFALPLASKALTATGTPNTPAVSAAGLGRAMRSLRAVEYRGGLGSVDLPMGAVDLGYTAYR